MPGEEELKPEVAIDEKTDGSIEVNLDKPEEGAKGVSSSEPKYVTVEDLEKIRKQLNGLSYLGRQFNEVVKKIDSLQAPDRQAPQPVNTTLDPYDELVQRDWKQAVRAISREESNIIRNQEAQEEQIRLQGQRKLSILEDSKNRVRSRYPELDDQNSDLSKRYISILNKNQDYLRNERGPLLAMADLEEELRSEGRLDEISKKAVEKEVVRQVRSTATSGVRSGVSNGARANTQVLTRDQKEFCDHNNIRYEDYGRMLKKQSESDSRKSVEV